MTRLPVVENVTCLGCGCACDDIDVTVSDGRLVELKNACELGVRWFGDGVVPDRVIAGGSENRIDDALTAAAVALGGAAHPVVYLAPGLSCESQRLGVAIADVLRARMETPTSDAARFVLATQERGFATATFGEVRNRADVVVYWAIDVAARYPRFVSRYAPAAGGLNVSGRRVVAIDVGAATSTVDADVRVAVEPQDERATLAMLQSLARGAKPDTSVPSAAAEIWSAIQGAGYVAVVFDAEPDERAERSCLRFDALVALSQALNDRTRCAGIALRAGGNRSGADSVVVAQTGSPFAVDFARGFPRYDPHGSTVVAPDVVLVVGDTSAAKPSVTQMVNKARTILVGPRASEATTLGEAIVVIDTGRDGIHAAGTAVRGDDVPLPLRASLSGGHRSTTNVLTSLITLIRQRR